MRIVTWNIRGGRGIDGIRSLQRIADTLKGFDADVICLQEVEVRMPQSALENQPAKLSQALGMKAVFQCNFRLGPGQFGNALLSRLPVKSRETIVLPNRRERASILKFPERRAALKVDLDGQLTTLCTHWSLDPNDRLESARLLADRIRQIESPVILAGDLNASPHSAEIGIIQSESGLVDAYPDAPPTYPADKPSTRIDYIWIPEGSKIREARLESTLASDHLPVALSISREIQFAIDQPSKLPGI